MSVTQEDLLKRVLAMRQQEAAAAQERNTVAQAPPVAAPPTQSAPPSPPVPSSTPIAQDSPPTSGPPSMDSQYYLRANDLEKQANAPPPQPHGLKENIIAGLQVGIPAFANPHGYQQLELQKQELARQGRQDKLGQVKELRQQGQFQDNQNRLIDTNASERDFQNRQLAMQQGNANSEATLRAAQVKKLGDPEYSLHEGSSGTFKIEKGSGVTEKLTGPPPVKGANLEHTILNVNGNPEVWALDMTNGTAVRKIGDAVPPGSGGSNEQILTTQDKDGKSIFYRVPKTGPEGPIASVTDPDKAPIQPKRAEAPAQLKNQADSANITNGMIGVVRKLVAEKPYLTGPVSGRVAELMLKFGGDEAGIAAYAAGQKDGVEKDAATLAGHLAYLFLNEARATMPGRPSATYMDFVKSRSAAMNQNPQVLEGFLKSAENNARIILNTAKDAGYDPFSKPVDTTPPTQGQNLKRTNKTTGEVQFSGDGGQTWHK